MWFGFQVPFKRAFLIYYLPFFMFNKKFFFWCSKLTFITRNTLARQLKKRGRLYLIVTFFDCKNCSVYFSVRNVKTLKSVCNFSWYSKTFLRENLEIDWSLCCSNSCLQVENLIENEKIVLLFNKNVKVFP